MKSFRVGALSLSLLMVLSTFTAVVPLTGCTPTAAQIQADGGAVAIAVHQIANVVRGNNPDLADKLDMGATALTNALANYNTSSPTDIINTAANVIQVALASIPQTAAYAPLVAVAVAALDVLLANLPANQAKIQALAVSGPPNPYRGMVKLKDEKDFKAKWNALAGVTPGFAPIK